MLDLAKMQGSKALEQAFHPTLFSAGQDWKVLRRGDCTPAQWPRDRAGGHKFPSDVAPAWHVAAAKSCARLPTAQN
jgi:hypothetical protein